MKHPDASGRLSFGLLLISQLITAAGFTFVMPFFPLYVQQLGVHGTGNAAAWAGILNGAGPVTMALAAPIWGRVADRYGRKPMLLRATFAGALIVGLMGLVGSPWQLLILRLIQGMLTGTVSAATTLVSASSPSQKVGSRLGVLQMVLFVAGAAGPFFGGVFVDLVGIRASFGVTAALLSASGLLILFGVGEERPRAVTVRRGGSEADGTVRAYLPKLLPGLVPLFVVQVAVMSVAPALPGFLSGLLAHRSQIATQVGELVGVSALASAVGSVTGGRLAARFGARRLIVAVLLLAGIASLPQAWVANLAELWVLRIIASLFLGVAVPVANVAIHDAVPRERQGAAFGVAASAISLGNVVGPLTGGFLSSLLGVWAAFLVPGVFLVIASTSLWALSLGGSPMPRSSVRAK